MANSYTHHTKKLETWKTGFDYRKTNLELSSQKYAWHIIAYLPLAIN